MDDDIVEWACKQIPNGMNPIVVCERHDLLAQIERQRHQVDRLNAALDDVTHLTNDRQVHHRIKEARRG